MGGGGATHYPPLPGFYVGEALKFCCIVTRSPGRVVNNQGFSECGIYRRGGNATRKFSLQEIISFYYIACRRETICWPLSYYSAQA